MARVKDLSGNFPASLDQNPSNGNIDGGSDQREGRVNKTIPIVCSDTVDIPMTEGLIVTTSGAYKVRYGNNTDDTVQIIAGQVINLKVKRVWATGSVATVGVSGVY